jgi:hypothetical protein
MGATERENTTDSLRVAFLKRLLVVAVLLNQVCFQNWHCFNTALAPQLVGVVEVFNSLHSGLYELRFVVTRSVARALGL